MDRWAKKGEPGYRIERPTRPTVAPKTPPISSGRQACVDCGSVTRKLAYPGPRDLTCWRAEKKKRKANRAAARVVRIYGITAEQKQMLIEFQGGGCICSDWTGYNGRTRALSVDHDHQTGVVRGVLCKHCNDLLGRVKDDPRYFERMAAYLANPPAVRLFGERVAPEAPRREAPNVGP